MIDSAIRLFKSVYHQDTWKHLTQCDVLFVRNDNDCAYIHDGQAYAHIIDSMGELCVGIGLITRSVATPYSKLTGLRAFNSPVSFNRHALIIKFLSIFIKIVRGNKKSCDWVIQQRMKLWVRILERAAPRFIIGVQPDTGLCRASKNKNILVYDLQHGVIADEHAWYGEKFRLSTPHEDLPDGFLCWDDLSANALRKWAPQKGIDVRVIGNPWFLRFYKKKQGDSLVNKATFSESIFNNNHPTILYTLSCRMWLEYPGFKKVILDVLEKVILDTCTKYNWLIRLHPVQMHGDEKRRTKKYLVHTFGNIETIDWHQCSTLPLPAVLMQTDLHITDMSSVVIEAGWLGIRSAILSTHVCDGGKYEKIFDYERIIGLADVLPQDHAVIKQWILDSLSKGKEATTLKDACIELDSFLTYMADSIETRHKNID